MLAINSLVIAPFGGSLAPDPEWRLNAYRRFCEAATAALETDLEDQKFQVALLAVTSLAAARHPEISFKFPSVTGTHHPSRLRWRMDAFRGFIEEAVWASEGDLQSAKLFPMAFQTVTDLAACNHTEEVCQTVSEFGALRPNNSPVGRETLRALVKHEPAVMTKVPFQSAKRLGCAHGIYLYENSDRYKARELFSSCIDLGAKKYSRAEAVHFLDDFIQQAQHRDRIIYRLAEEKRAQLIAS